MDKVQIQKTSHLMKMCMLRLVMSEDWFEGYNGRLRKVMTRRTTGKVSYANRVCLSVDEIDCFIVW